LRIQAKEKLQLRNEIDSLRSELITERARLDRQEHLLEKLMKRLDVVESSAKPVAMAPPSAEPVTTMLQEPKQNVSELQPVTHKKEEPTASTPIQDVARSVLDNVLSDALTMLYQRRAFSQQFLHEDPVQAEAQSVAVANIANEDQKEQQQQQLQMPSSPTRRVSL
jgi:hypothetical protein